MQFCFGMTAILGGFGISYPSTLAIGLIGDIFVVLSYIAIGQLLFWGRQYSLQTRYLLPNSGQQNDNDSKWTIAAAIDTAESKLTPFAYVVMMALWEQDGITIADLVLTTSIDGGAMTQILKKMVSWNATPFSPIFLFPRFFEKFAIFNLHFH